MKRDTYMNALLRMKVWKLMLCIVMFSEFFTAIMNSINSYLWWGRLDRDLMIIGSIDAFIVSFIVGGMVVFLFSMVRTKEEALSESEERYRSLFEYSKDGISISKGDRVVAKNKALLDIEGYESLEESARTPFIEKLTPKSRETFLAHRERQDEGAPVEPFLELQIIRKDGSIRDIEISSVGLPLSGEPHTLSTFRDITERKNLEEQLRHSQKMDTIGQLTASISHEFSNVLTVIKGYGELLKDELGTDSRLSEYTKVMNESTKRAINLTQGLLLYSRKQITRFETFDINDGIRNVLTLLMKIIGKDVELRLALTEGQLLVHADRNQMEQVFMNLVNNSKDAMPDGGEITIVSEHVSAEEPFKTFDGDAREGQYAHISISDTGKGLYGINKESIFEPFYTTKEPGQGTGLGLSIVYGIIKKHNGFIDVNSGMDKGLTFDIYLPVSLQ